MCMAKFSSIMCFFVVFVIILGFVRQVYSRTCYVCESSVDGLCFSNAKNSGFQDNCMKTITNDSSNIDSSFIYLQTLAKKHFADYRHGSNYSFDCLTIIGRTWEEEKVIRGCVPKSKNCSIFETSLMILGFLTDSCDLCNANLCNSHSPLNINRLTPIHKNTKNYAEATIKTIIDKDTGTYNETIKKAVISKETENYPEETYVEAKGLTSLAKAVKFNYRIGFSCTVVLLVSTFFKCLV
ncbi:uncharacterized protein LOC131665894 [Phymastichus coffea]|uniref:uncharacterized protein LOC131665894 n=1 Tax=Phymastichus coffea TaxID=108790 RepID=UPI00273B4A6E|nr:uncharacterized protein LOC131665894 [Phymastichus coffea]XP_058794105.1 uncharacterized protein LOC131665894 [Phymastichus coffea]